MNKLWFIVGLASLVVLSSLLFLTWTVRGERGQAVENAGIALKNAEASLRQVAPLEYAAFEKSVEVQKRAEKSHTRSGMISCLLSLVMGIVCHSHYKHYVSRRRKRTRTTNLGQAVI
jgi:hypothetical protein